jgi:hypothetical protein
VAFREIRKRVTVPVGDDALDIIEGQCRKWHAEEETEYAAKGINPAEMAEDSRPKRPLRRYRKTPDFRRHTKKNSGVTHSPGQEPRG